MKLLEFIKEITDSDEEFLAVIKEMNTWIKGDDNEEKNKSLYVPNYHGRFDFTREEHRRALERAITGHKKYKERARISTTTLQ